MWVILLLCFVSVEARWISPEENLNAPRHIADNLIEGDMIIEGGVRGSIKKNLWPNGVLVYDMHSSISQSSQARRAIQDAMNDWSKYTCIRFKRRTTEAAYVWMYRGGGCSSYVGRTGRRQEMSLATGCWHKGVVIHEIGHALGFLHEQSRPDRDNYVTIVWSNIRQGSEHNFRKGTNVDSLGTPYDYGSIMHYGEKYFSKNNRPTIVVKTPGATIGNRNGLSNTDKLQMNRLYKCGGGPTPPPPKPPPSGNLNCDFNSNDCGFKQSSNDNFDWIRRKGRTPSGKTGPSDDNGGGGFYMYTEASRPRQSGDKAIMETDVVLNGRSCLSLYYHMYGSQMGTLRISVDNQPVFSKSGDQGNKWIHAKDIALPGNGNKKLQFEGIRGSGFRSDLAVDDISISDCNQGPGPGPSPAPPPSPGACGKRPQDARVVGGQNAQPHSWPWQISLRINGGHICGGSLIAKQYVLTAAHCVNSNPSPSRYTVVVGAHRRTGTTSVQETLRVIELHIHNGFSMQTLRHDVALLKLDRPVKLSDKVMPVCLSSTRPSPGTRCYITGWGRTYGGGPLPDILQQAMLPVVSTNDCRIKYGNFIDANAHLCAGSGRASSSGGCNGDSGGPLACQSSGNWFLHGVVSFGRQNCPTTHFTVFARVTSYLQWVKDKMGSAPPPPPKPTSNPRPPTQAPPASTFFCNFDKDLCGFRQRQDDTYDFTRRTENTPSLGTGPDADHTSGQGSYMYIEASSPRKQGDNAKLSVTLQVPSDSCLRFYYHMFGKYTGTLRVQARGGTVFQMSGDQGNQWRKAEIRLQISGSLEIVFEAIRGASWQGDVAFDDVSVARCGGGGPGPGPSPAPPPSPASCGTKYQGRIVGGEAAKHGEWPWQAMLRTSSGSQFCGGTLVALQWVVTAAHCLGRRLPSVRMGAQKRVGNIGGEQDFTVVKQIKHPSYNNPKGMAHDIALLKLNKPATLSKYVGLACLPNSVPAPTDGDKCWITGWGTLSSGGSTPNDLQQASVPVVSRARCDRSYPGKIHDSMICAGLDQGGIDTCQGDSGGPMVCESGGRFYLQGATSWGYGCAARGRFGVYAKVKYLLSWITSEISKN